MFRIKAIAAVVLGGLGGATLGTDVYLASHDTAAPPVAAVVTPAPSPPLVTEAPKSVADSNPILILSPVTIYSRNVARIARRAPAAEPVKSELVVCSNWRSLATGPEGRGVRTLCVPGQTAAR